jgi:cobalamin biosynthetic protein CobC
LLEHGGALRAAAARYGIALNQWLDLSTGINPRSWPVPTLPTAVWRRLPEENDGLEGIAAAYYGSPQLLLVPGSQTAIQVLPALRGPGRVGVLTPGYSEYAHTWRYYGHQVLPLAAEAVESALEDIDVLVLGNPNNPTGERFPATVLLEWRLRLASRGGWLLVDEAFMDATPEQSLATHAGLPGLVVLRSLGKFFGLAGIRVGCVCCEDSLQRRLRDHLGPWAVNGPGRWIAARALSDRGWQRDTRRTLQRASARLAELLGRYGLAVSGGTPLFQWVQQEEAVFFQDALARRGIWVRRFDDPPSLRLGLPDSDSAWRRLTQALAGIRAQRQALR